MNNPSHDLKMLPSSTGDMNLILENQKLKEEVAMLRQKIEEMTKSSPRRSKRLRIESLDDEGEN